MGILNRLFRNEVKTIESNDVGVHPFLMGKDDMHLGENISEVTYFTCLKLLSETIGKLNIDLYQDTDHGIRRVNDHNVYKLLKTRPNPYMTPTVFKSLIEFNRN